VIPFSDIKKDVFLPVPFKGQESGKEGLKNWKTTVEEGKKECSINYKMKGN
jgi:hypothetical protein